MGALLTAKVNVGVNFQYNLSGQDFRIFMITNTHYLNRIISAVLGLGLVASGLFLHGVEPSVGTGAPDLNVASAGLCAESSGPALVKVPIKDIPLGTRVPAFNPEVSAAERRGFTEPNWYRWMKLKLEMPKPDGTLLEIEMLRPEDWLIEQMTLVVEPIPVMLSGVDELLPLMESPSGSSSSIEIASATEFNQATASQDSSDFSLVGVPLRPIYGHIAERLIEAAADRNQVLGMVVELDLPELGIRGPAWIVDLEPAPLVPLGPGQVVTATFKHASANVLDLVLTNTPPTNLSTPPTTLTALNTSPSVNPAYATLSPPPTDRGVAPTDTIGVTANHPFWSVDRAEFVQAGELQIGERLQTLTGDIHWVQQKLPRPGPEAVYNLEVHDEHVYYVGRSGALAHNSCEILARQKKLAQLVNRQGEVIDRWLSSSTNRWAQLYRMSVNSNPNFANMIRGRFLDIRMRSKLASIFRGQPGVRIDRTIPGSGRLRPDLYFPEIGGRSVIFDIGSQSKISGILKYQGMADELIPLVPIQWIH